MNSKYLLNYLTVNELTIKCDKRASFYMFFNLRSKICHLEVKKVKSQNLEKLKGCLSILPLFKATFENKSLNLPIH